MSPSAGPIRVMTANLLIDGAGPASLTALLDAHDPDLVFLQEMSPESGAVLADRFTHHLLFPGAGPQGRGVASRMDAELGTLDLPWRPGTYARLTHAGSTLVAAGVHMPNPIVFPWWRSARERREMLQAVLSWVAGEGAGGLVVVGDMNASPAWPLYRRLAERLDDLPALAASREGAKPERTWGWRPGWPRMLRIDHVFGLRVGVAASRTEPIRGSDHHALVVDISLSEEG